MLENKKAMLIAGGEIGSPVFYAPYLAEADFILCADSGFDNAKKIGAEVDLVIGDFDSARAVPPESIEQKKLPCEKDRTDSQACLEYLLDKGYKHITMTGCIGSRFDHTYANILMLFSAHKRGAFCRIINSHNEIMLAGSHICVQRREGWHLSLLPLEPCYGITTKGLYYPLENAEMGLDYPCGVSNEFTEEQAEITLAGGLLLVMLCKD